MARAHGGGAEEGDAVGCGQAALREGVWWVVPWQGVAAVANSTDRRGTMSYQIYPDDKVHASKGFMKLPIKQRAKWARDGSLLVEERYSQHLGGDEHGKPCKGDSCPIVKSRRSVDKSGDMVVEIERTLLSGETIRMKTYYQAVPS